ncbi:MAG: ATP-binding protein [Candidatus Caenarcaniphilales bacterium]|nr:MULTISPECIES: ATP-binding protein [Crocosphaera]MCH2228632.1 ATP-binding protein [Candidatus Caenarcaniphilales bacterium]NQZ60812.1 ATP-binding protein [Crocosphaera sp.]
MAIQMEREMIDNMASHSANDEINKKIDQAFTPRTPIETRQFFAGRMEQIKKIQSSFDEKGCQIMIYGDRGVGKTSLANIVKEIYTNNNYNVVCTKVNCDPTETFDSIWRKTFKQVNFYYQVKNKQNIGFISNSSEVDTEEKISNISIDKLLKLDKELTTTDVLDTLSEYFTKQKFLFIFDEFDQIQNSEIKEKFTYLMKNISDYGTDITLMIVGIAENIEELIESHQSVERCLKQINLPRMSEKEIEQIISTGLSYIGMTMDQNLKSKI